MEEELIKNDWHEDYAKSIKAIFDKHSREKASDKDSKPAVYENDFPLVVEELYELFMKIHRIE